MGKTTECIKEWNDLQPAGDIAPPICGIGDDQWIDFLGSEYDG